MQRLGKVRFVKTLPSQSPIRFVRGVGAAGRRGGKEGSTGQRGVEVGIARPERARLLRGGGDLARPGELPFVRRREEEDEGKNVTTG